MPTWDAWGLVVDLAKDIQTAMSTDSSYTASQRSLVTCLNGLRPVSGSTSTIGSFTSFENVLSSYTGSTKRNLDSGGACNTQGEAMFRTVQTVAKTKLASLKSTRPEYAAFLATNPGRDLELNIGDASTVKRNAALLAKASAAGASGSSGQGASSQDTGLSCLPENGREPSTLQGKLDVLNCLAFTTPYSFWQEQTRNPTLRNLINRPGYRDWLDYEHWDCSRSPDSDATLPACLKHDVVWDSLRAFVSNTPDDTLDAAWNPRNKYLADEEFFSDLTSYECPRVRTGIANVKVINEWCVTTVVARAFVMQFAVRNWNDKSNEGWVYTRYDLDHIDSNYEYTSYNIPSVTNVTVSRFPARLPHQTAYKVSWRYAPGTVSGATVDEYRLVWKPAFGTMLEYEVSSSDVTTESNGKLSYTLYILARIEEFVSLEISPNRKLWSPLLFASYYPSHKVNLRY